MISIGINFGGPEQEGSRVQRLLTRTAQMIVKERGSLVGPCDLHLSKERCFELGSSPALNVVFYVPGSLIEFADLKKIEAARFSRKQKLLLVAVPVPKEQVAAGGSVDFVINALHEANHIAAEAFARKGTEPFDLRTAEGIVDKVQQALVDQGF